ncbi:MAG TPA: serine hydrolase, partial [Thermoanaerobaculia bacterium]
GSEASMTLLERSLSPLRDEENQVSEFIGEALPAGSRLWSKAGWTSEVRHDAAYVELPDGRKFVVVIFTRGIAEDVTIVPAVAKAVLGELDVTPTGTP